MSFYSSYRWMYGASERGEQPTPKGDNMRVFVRYIETRRAWAVFITTPHRRLQPIECIANGLTEGEAAQIIRGRTLQAENSAIAIARQNFSEYRAAVRRRAIKRQLLRAGIAVPDKAMNNLNRLRAIRREQYGKGHTHDRVHC